MIKLKFFNNITLVFLNYMNLKKRQYVLINMYFNDKDSNYFYMLILGFNYVRGFLLLIIELSSYR